jgi:hypothetical protein
MAHQLTGPAHERRVQIDRSVPLTSRRAPDGKAGQLPSGQLLVGPHTGVASEPFAAVELTATDDTTQES